MGINDISNIVKAAFAPKTVSEICHYYREGGRKEVVGFKLDGISREVEITADGAFNAKLTEALREFKNSLSVE